MDEGILDTGNEGVRCADSIPLTSTQENIVKIAHYATYVTGYIAFYRTYKRLDILKQRIWSPLILLTSIVFLIVGPGFEIAEHYFTEPRPWELQKAPDNLINGSFSFFNFGGVCLMALGVRKIGVPIFRVPSFDNLLAGLLDLVVMLADIVVAAMLILQPFLYISLGRQGSQAFTTPINAASGILILFRLWKNLGPNKHTLAGGIGYLALTLSGVFSLQRYEKECVEFIHLFIGGSFVTSLLFYSLAIINAEASSGESGEITNENTPLNRV